MTLIALDLNASRLRMMHALSPREGRPIVLDDPDAELPLAFSLEGRTPEIGRAGPALCRRSPHLACVNFLPSLGESKEWAGPRCRLDAGRALGLVLDHVAPKVGKHVAAAVAVPDYLARDQRSIVRRACEQARLKVFGSLGLSLAAALSAHAQDAWEGPAIVGDIDEHALSWTPVLAGATMKTLPPHAQPTLGLRVWKDRLLDMVADACIRLSRRDPRDSADAEQMIYDQLDVLLLASLENRPAEIDLRSGVFNQCILLNPIDVSSACRGLIERANTTFMAALDSLADHGPPATVILTIAAARLPGLLPALEKTINEHLGGVPVRVLEPDAVGRAILDLASRWQKGALPSGHIDAAPLPEAESPAIGAARLHYRGTDHPFRSAEFLLGRDSRCDLVFETEEFPWISGRHCRIVSENGGFVLYDMSRHGTLVNEHAVTERKALEPGDWIRLGPAGPLLRFLGHALDPKLMMMPTA